MNLALQYENSEDTVALDREFDGTDTQNTRYAATVGHGVSTVVVKYETKDQLATAQIREGGAETDGVVANERTLQDSDNGAVPLEVGDNVNTVTVEVTAEDGVTVITYVVTITRGRAVQCRHVTESVAGSWRVVPDVQLRYRPLYGGSAAWR